MTRFARAKGSKGSNNKKAEEPTPWHILKQEAAELRSIAANSSFPQPPPETNWKEEINKEKLVSQNTNPTWAEFEPVQTFKANQKNTRPQPEYGSLDEDAQQPPKKKKKKMMKPVTDESDKEKCEKPNDLPDEQKELGEHSAKRVDEDHKLNKYPRKEHNKTRGRKIKEQKKPQKKLNPRRKKPEVKTQVLDINGRQVEVAMFDRFIIKKEDAERLKELAQMMKNKGVPGVEIQRTLKLERRRAEKALAREKKKVCFQCRLGGHTLANCPLNHSQGKTGLNIDREIRGNEMNTSGGPICYKCGSTEHKAFQCRVKQGSKEESFSFATCFICKEEGHISRQCPDNPRGLYPKGGACRLCGDVTHLKKDCPTALAQKQAAPKLTLSTIDSNTSLEALDNEPAQNIVINNNNKPVQKIIKF